MLFGSHGVEKDHQTTSIQKTRLAPACADARMSARSFEGVLVGVYVCVCVCVCAYVQVCTVYTGTLSPKPQTPNSKA